MRSDIASPNPPHRLNIIIAYRSKSLYSATYSIDLILKIWDPRGSDSSAAPALEEVRHFTRTHCVVDPIHNHSCDSGVIFCTITGCKSRCESDDSPCAIPCRPSCLGSVTWTDIHSLHEPRWPSPSTQSITSAQPGDHPGPFSGRCSAPTAPRDLTKDCDRRQRLKLRRRHNETQSVDTNDHRGR